MNARCASHAEVDPGGAGGRGGGVCPGSAAEPVATPGEFAVATGGGIWAAAGENLPEFALLMHSGNPRYCIRIGINYHGEKVQQIALDNNGKLIGWNPAGDALGTGAKAKMRLAGYTIFDRDPNEPMMNDSKIGGGSIPSGRYVRVEFKVRGWLGKTKNLDGKQLEKDLDLLKSENADLLVMPPSHHPLQLPARVRRHSWLQPKCLERAAHRLRESPVIRAIGSPTPHPDPVGQPDADATDVGAVCRNAGLLLLDV